MLFTRGVQNVGVFFSFAFCSLNLMLGGSLPLYIHLRSPKSQDPSKTLARQSQPNHIITPPTKIQDNCPTISRHSLACRFQPDNLSVIKGRVVGLQILDRLMIVTEVVVTIVTDGGGYDDDIDRWWWF